MFERLGALAVRRRLWVLALTLLGVIAAGAVGGGAIDSLSNGGYTDPDSESARAATMLDERFGQGQPTLNRRTPISLARASSMPMSSSAWRTSR